MGQDWGEGLVDKGRLARPRHARYHYEIAKGKLRVNMLEIVAARTHYLDAFAITLASYGRHGNLTFAIEILSGYGVGLQHFLWRALKNHFAAFASCPRANVHYPVGSPHHVLVVLNHNDRVAKVAQLLE